MLAVAIDEQNEPEDTDKTHGCICLDTTQIERAMLLAGIDTYDDMRLCSTRSDIPDEVVVCRDF
jgi:hypothetical protein